MVLVAPLAGRWYDRVGGRTPLAVGFGVLLASGVVLAWAVHANAYLPLLPGLLLYGTGLALILTVNDPVSLDTIPDRDDGEASGVSATAEQFGGAVGIALLYLVFHATYLNRLYAAINAGPLPHLSAAQAQRFKDAIMAAESTGLRPQSFDSALARYLGPARAASADGYSAAFAAMSVLALVALVLMIYLIRRPAADPVAAGGDPDAPSAAPPPAGAR
jgi:MFS family permease